MGLAETKNALEQILITSDAKVVALSGKWGTGKSYMWDEIRREGQVSALNEALYLSLFGVATISDLKIKLAQAAAPLISKKGFVRDAATGIYTLGKGVLKAVAPYTSAIDEIVALAVPALVRGKFIVIDDVERKHENLSIDEVLGFIDDFTKVYECRVLLILNSDKLDGIELWEKFREKVIDEEVRLNTTPEEAFDVAVLGRPGVYLDRVKKAVVACNLTNIRVIRKIIQIIGKLLKSKNQLTESVQHRLIPSTVLLSAIHYKGLEKGPSAEFVLSYSQNLVFDALNKNKKVELGDEEKLRAEWALLFDRLGIDSVGDYEKEVQTYLSSGLIDQERLDAIIDLHIKDFKGAAARDAVQVFFDSARWDLHKTADELLEEATCLRSHVDFLDVFSVSELHGVLVALNMGALGDEFISRSLEKITNNVSRMDAVSGAYWSMRGKALHPRLALAVEEIRENLKPKKSLFSVIHFLAYSNGWNPDDEAVLQAATMEDFYATIAEARGENLKVFMLKSLDMLAHRETYDKHFGNALDNFVAACKKMIADRTGTRSELMLRSCFEETRMEKLLD